MTAPFVNPGWIGGDYGITSRTLATEAVNNIAAGHIGGDAALEIVAVTASHLYVFDAATLAPK